MSAFSMRIALGIEYDGSGFHGWQSQQPGVRTVQAALEAALTRVADHPVQVVCAGRTDTGVHASGQVVHFDTTARRDHRAWTLGANTHLPKDVSVAWARTVPEDFHARFTAQARRYRYVVFTRPTRSAVLRRQAWWIHAPLDVARMNEAAAHLLGEHNFSSFRAAECQAKTAVRRLHRLHVARQGNLITLDVEANAFLHHMVRNLTGVLVAIGKGDRPPEWAAEVLAARDRRCGGVTAPPQGLTFVAVRYPERYDLPFPAGDEADALALAVE